MNWSDFLGNIAAGIAGVPTIASDPLGRATQKLNPITLDSPSAASTVQDSNSLVDIPSDTSSDSNNFNNYDDFNYYDQYLEMLQKGANVGLFSTAQDAVNEAQKDRAFQSLEAEKVRNWYEDMSNSSFQRQVADLEAAGLNPILGWAHSGVGAASAMPSSPTGRSTNIASQAPSISDYINAGANLINSASNLLQYFIPKLFSGSNTNLSEILSQANNTSHVFIHK